MKKILVFSLYEEAGNYYKNHIKDIFSNKVEVESYYIEGNLNDLHLEADLILVTSHIIYKHIENLNKNNVETLIINRSFTKEGFDKLRNFNTDKDVIFVSTFFELAVECVANLYELGIQGINIIPYNPHSPHKEDLKDVKTAITAGESKLIPQHIENVIDLGNRIFDLGTVISIAKKIGLNSRETDLILDEHRKKVVFSDQGYQKMLYESKKIKKELKTILSFISDSVIATDVSGVIVEYNKASQEIFQLKRKEVIDRVLVDVFQEFSIIDNKNPAKIETNILLKINDIYIVTNKYPLMDDNDGTIGFIYISKKYMEMENEQIKIRSKFIPKGHIASYAFADILGDSKEISDLKNIAIGMAKTESNIFINGETGTGKEIFAQSIHNASTRKNRPFVAINCATLNHSLLESELFGYEEGAFTGAKKGGKVGLFELANKGTIFLDEIAEMPLEIQAKLLRVLDEKKVMRIGGTDLITIDTRIISATNKDLNKAVENGEFREDLLYRINVLPITIPPLRDRKEDIEILFKSFLKAFNGGKEYSMEVARSLKQYPWPGNIRELKNCAEYMYHLSDDIIRKENLPIHIKNYLKKTSYEPVEKEERFEELNKDEKLILNILYRLNSQGKTAGRKLLSEETGKVRDLIPEQNVSFILHKLEEKDLVRINLGRRGSEITEEGIKCVEN